MGRVRRAAAGPVTGRRRPWSVPNGPLDPLRVTGYSGTVSRAVALLVVFTCAVGPVWAGPDPPAREELIRAQETLVRTTREYQESLERVVGFQEATARRATETARQRRELLGRGIVAPREVEESERVEAEALATLAQTRARVQETQRLRVEAEAALELAMLPPTPPGGSVTTARLIHYGGGLEPAVPSLGLLQQFFLSRFGHAPPVSALGQTPLHDRLGFDHRHAIDVAVHPESEEGRALLAFLRDQHIPFLAFRNAVPGASTGAHVHVGKPSDRLLPTGSALR
jgi:hypothetical protein